MDISTSLLGTKSKFSKGCLENSDLENLDLRPSGCLENSDSKNSDPFGVSKTQTLWMSRKLRPHGCLSKTQTLRKLDNFERFLKP